MVAKAQGALKCWLFPKASGIRIRAMLILHGGEAYGVFELEIHLAACARQQEFAQALFLTIRRKGPHSAK